MRVGFVRRQDQQRYRRLRGEKSDKKESFVLGLVDVLKECGEADAKKSVGTKTLGMDGWERRGKGAKADGRRAGWSPFQRAAEKGRPADLEFSWGGQGGGSRAAGVLSIRNLGTDSRVGCGGPAPQCGHLGSACLASAGRRPIGWLFLAARDRTNEPARCFKNSGPLLLLERTPFLLGRSVMEDSDGIMALWWDSRESSTATRAPSNNRLPHCMLSMSS